MSKVIVFAGTTEGRNMSEWLCSKSIEHIVCVATEYGEQVLGESEFAIVHQGRMDEEEMIAFFKEQNPEIIVDATHPYANIVTENIKSAAEKSNVKYIRLEREDELRKGESDKLFFKDAGECAKSLEGTHGNILLTTGSKELSVFCKNEDMKERLYVRVLPGKESLSICEDEGIKGKHVIAMQGPFSVEMNVALMKQFDIKNLVTKDSGNAGGFYEKIEAAESLGVSVYVIGRPSGDKGCSFKEVCECVSKVLGISMEDTSEKYTISLIGCGMGKKNGMTIEAMDAIEKSKVVFGAKRLLENLNIEKEQYPYYLADDIIPYLKENPKDAAILFSGDLGFFSGAKKMKEALEREIESGDKLIDLEFYPGISSIVNLSAKIGETWDDAKIISIHGKGEASQWMVELLNEIRHNKKVFLLLSGVKDIQAIGKSLIDNNLGDCKIAMGYQMAQDNQEIKFLSPSDCIERTEEGLYSLFIYNDSACKECITTGVCDEEFIRDKVPMTKEEVRTVSISKLHLNEGAIVYDVGSGTGSIAVEIAKLRGVKKVYAIERNPDAIELINKNIEKFNITNVCVVEGDASEVLDKLPSPTHVFIGGSGGKLDKILDVIYKKNSTANIVANAVSYETINELMQIENKFNTEDFEMIAMSVTRMKQAGTYHMMKSENQISICSFKFKSN